MDNLDILMADMETFKTHRPGYKDKSRKIEIENEKIDKFEKKLENLTDKLLDAFKQDAEDVDPEPVIEKDDLGYCETCGLPIQESAVLAGGQTFHQHCFTCNHCGDILGSKFYVVSGSNYCEKDQTVALSSCTLCGHPIKDGSVLVNSQPYHQTCFTCSQCSIAIGGKFYTQKDGSFLCEQDYQQSREKCAHCTLPILDKVLAAVDNKFHPACFRCALCDIGLEGVSFLVSSGSVNCQACYTKYKAAQCVRCCQGIVSTGQRKTSLVTCQGRTYHQDCYTCGDCGSDLAGQFVCAVGDEIVCFHCDTKRRKK